MRTHHIFIEEKDETTGVAVVAQHQTVSDSQERKVAIWKARCQMNNAMHYQNVATKIKWKTLKWTKKSRYKTTHINVAVEASSHDHSRNAHSMQINRQTKEKSFVFPTVSSSFD